MSALPAARAGAARPSASPARRAVPCARPRCPALAAQRRTFPPALAEEALSRGNGGPRWRQPRRLPPVRPAEEDALQAAAEAETSAPPTRTEEAIFAEVAKARALYSHSSPAPGRDRRAQSTPCFACVSPKPSFPLHPLQRAEEQGATKLLEAYVRILGRRVAFLAVVGNKMMLANPNTVDEIDGIVAEITRLAGKDGASRILYREPSVLYCAPTAVSETIAALEETLGSAAGAFALGRNPALMQSGRAAHIRVSLQTLQDVLGGDGALAAEIVQKNTMLMGTNGETLRAAFDALCAMFGGAEAAIALIRCNPGLLRTRVSTLYESIEALAEIFGNMDDAADAVNLNRSLLKARPETLRGSFAALQEVYGSVEAARAVARMQLGVLRSSPVTIRAAHAALRSECGEAAARSMIEMTPGLLQIRPAALRYNLAHFKAFLGDERGSAMADAMPHLIKMRVGRAAEVTAAMVEVYGSKEAAAANCVRAPR